MKKAVKLLALALALMTGVLCMFGCGAKKYRVDYDGQKSFYHEAKDAYPAGTQVTVYMDIIATDTDYTFYLDDQPINVTYAEGKGFCISFLMPDHDVKLTYTMRNTMEYEP